MLAENNAIATVAVKNIATARKFYEGKLGFKPVHEEGPEVVTYQSGKGELLVYESKFAGTNKATSVTFIVDNVENDVKDLKAKGVAFEHYDMPGVTRQGDVHLVGDGLKNAWFKDPDGNILS